MRFYIGMDVGGTNLRLKLRDAAGGPAREYISPSCLINLHEDEQVFTRFSELIMGALRENGFEPADCAGLCIGASGVDSEESLEKHMEIFRRLGFDKAKIRIYNDCELLLHAHEEKPAIVVIAGTGSIVVGQDKNGKVSRWGGLGHILSDEASGYYLVKNAIKAVLTDMDGGAACPVLKDLLTSAMKLYTQEAIAVFVMENIINKSNVSCFSPVVSRAAELGDPAAIMIYEEAAQRLFEGIEIIAKKISAGADGPYTVWLWGGVVYNDRNLSDRLIARMKTCLPAAVAAFPQQSALDSALDIAARIG